MDSCGQAGAYALGLPPPLAASLDSAIRLQPSEGRGALFPVHRQIVCLHSPVLADLLAGPPTEPASNGLPPIYELHVHAPPAAADADAETPRTAARSYDPRRRPALSAESLCVFFRHCYVRGLEAGPSSLASLGKLLDTAEWLGCCSAAPAVDCYLNRLLLLEAHADLAGAARLASRHRLERTTAAVLPLMSHRGGGGGGGGRRSEEGAGLDWEGAFDALLTDEQGIRLAFVLARATPAEREQMGATDLAGAARWCGAALKDSGWASRGRAGGAGSAPGHSSGGSSGGAFGGGGSSHLTGW